MQLVTRRVRRQRVRVERRTVRDGRRHGRQVDPVEQTRRRDEGVAHVASQGTAGLRGTDREADGPVQVLFTAAGQRQRQLV